jgi:hypothetical protein
MLQRHQRLPHSGLSHPDLPCDARFHHAIARLQVTRDDHGANAAGDLIHHRRPPAQLMRKLGQLASYGCFR